MSKEAMKLALEALDIVNPREFAQADPDGKIDKAITAMREALAEQPAQQGCMRCNTPKKCALYGCSPLTWPSEKPAQQEPVAHAVIAGALFDFMGWLTSRKERLVLSSADNASPAVEAITEFAKMRGLSLNDAKVQDWNTSPPAQQEPVAWPCLIAEADFSEDTVTLAMQCTDYKVSAGKHWLSNTPPAQRTWVGLTNNELQPIADEYRILFGSWVEDFARAIEANLRSKNNG